MDGDLQFPQTFAIVNKTKVQWPGRDRIGYKEQWLPWRIIFN
jgi:hypothetical protein